MGYTLVIAYIKYSRSLYGKDYVLLFVDENLPYIVALKNENGGDRDVNGGNNLWWRSVMGTSDGACFGGVLKLDC